MNVEIKKCFDDIYSIIKSSDKIADMQLFGSVMSDLMYDYIEKHPEKASRYIAKLSLVKWNNYLTEEEARAILSKMNPGMRWDFDSFSNIINGMRGEIEKDPCYNKYSLWVTMNMIFSDSANTIANIMGKSIDTIPENEITTAIYLLAIDKLCDLDGVFSIRKYFSV